MLWNIQRGGLSSGPHLGLSRLEREIQKGAGHHGTEALGVSEAVGLGDGMSLIHLAPLSAGTSQGLLVMGAAVSPAESCPFMPHCPRSSYSQRGEKPRQGGRMNLELLRLEFIAESCFVYSTRAHTHMHTQTRRKEKKMIVFPEGRKAQVISIKRSTSSPELECRLLGTGWLTVRE